jgi:hypothetical protein
MTPVEESGPGEETPPLSPVLSACPAEEDLYRARETPSAAFSNPLSLPESVVPEPSSEDLRETRAEEELRRVPDANNVERS